MIDSESLACFLETLSPLDAVLWMAAYKKQVDIEYIHLAQFSVTDLAVCIANGNPEFPPVIEAYELALNWYYRIERRSS